MSKTGDVAGMVEDGGWRSTSLRERDCLEREEPLRREGWRSTRALSLRATFLLQEGGGKVRWERVEERGGKTRVEGGGRAT